MLLPRNLNHDKGFLSSNRSKLVSLCGSKAVDAVTGKRQLFIEERTMSYTQEQPWQDHRRCSGIYMSFCRHLLIVNNVAQEQCLVTTDPCPITSLSIRVLRETQHPLGKRLNRSCRRIQCGRSTLLHHSQLKNVSLWLVESAQKSQ